MDGGETFKERRGGAARGTDEWVPASASGPPSNPTTGAAFAATFATSTVPGGEA